MSVIADGNTKYVSGGDPACGGDQFTAMAWIYPTTINQVGTIFGFPGGLGGAFMIGGSSTDSSGDRLLATAPGVFWSSTATHTFTANAWYHVAWTVGTNASDNWYLYKNGVEQSMGVGGGINASNTNYGFGKRLENGNWRQAFTGRLAYLKVWNKQLTTAQVQSERFSKLPLFEYSSLKIYLPTDNVSLPSAFPDLSGNGLSGTPQGTPSIADGPPI